MSDINWQDDTTRRYLTGAVARPDPSNPDDTTRRCFYVDPGVSDERGVIALLVFEDRPGYTPMVGANPPGSTWYWGTDVEEAAAVADLVNAELFGLTRDDSYEIVDSSMNAQDDADAGVSR